MVALAVNLAPSFKLHDEPWAGIRHGHGHRTQCGYVVRRTYFDGRPHEDAGVFDVDLYGAALDLAREVRAEQGAAGYAVIDSLHECGCRELG